MPLAPDLFIELGKINAAVSAATFLACQRATCYRLRTNEHGLEIVREVPAGIEHPRAFHANTSRPRLQLLQLAHGLVHIFFHSENAYQVLHHFLQITMNTVWILAIAALKGRKHVALGFSDLGFIGISSGCFTSVGSGGETCPPSKDQQIR